ncbi:hypothetical protein [Achromobacter spanius]|uniref:Uncharacterized protein n=1 Tax=Achromobacter spanius TaxID=217203 RepID=A0AAW3I3F3_9BURK|nr:hypothetical protein [Achromobacter spanius]KNE27057.1 hypothetical protein AFM18_14365 [Achromobacter spanius]
MASNESVDPGTSLLRVLIPLYHAGEVTGYSGQQAAESLPPTEALALAMMCLTKTYSSTGLSMKLHIEYHAFDRRESAIAAEVGILGLMRLGYLRPASKKDEKALLERNEESWGLGNVSFLITAKGAKRIAPLVATTTGEPVKDVVKRLQADSREYAKTRVLPQTAD